jgi:hypothetical protein
VWLSVWKSALKSLEKRILAEVHDSRGKASGDTASDVVVSMPVLEKLHREASIAVLGLAKASEDLPAPLWRTEIADDVQCFTDFEPRARLDTSLSHLAVSGLAGKPDRNQGASRPSGESGWESIVFETLMDPDSVRSAKLKGYQDWKNIIYGNNESGTLTLEVSVKKPGKIFLCESPGIWNKIPENFDHLWTAKPDIRLVKLSGGKPVAKKSIFGKKSVPTMPMVRAKEGEICAVSRDVIGAGSYYLSIRPKTSKYIMLGTLVVP